MRSPEFWGSDKISCEVDAVRAISSVSVEFYHKLFYGNLRRLTCQSPAPLVLYYTHR